MIIFSKIIKKIHYLGINLKGNFQGLCEQNLPILLEDIKEDLTE